MDKLKIFTVSILLAACTSGGGHDYRRTAADKFDSFQVDVMEWEQREALVAEDSTRAYREGQAYMK